MCSPEGFQCLRVPGLHAETDSRDTTLSEERGLFGTEGCWVRLDSPFLDRCEVDSLFETVEEVGELFNTQGGRSASTKIKGFRLDVMAGRREVNLLEECIEESRCFVLRPLLKVEAAVRAGLWAERDVEVEVFNHGLEGGTVLWVEYGPELG